MVDNLSWELFKKEVALYQIKTGNVGLLNIESPTLSAENLIMGCKRVR